MTIEIIFQVLLLSVALSMDAFCVSICDGLVYQNLNRRRLLFIAADFGVMQGLMPLIGFFIADLFYEYIKDIVPWIAFTLLLFIGGKMIYDGIKSVIKKDEEQVAKSFTYSGVLIAGVATSIDALATGVSMLTISTSTTILLHCSMICVITFLFCIVGIFLGKNINKLLKGKYEIANIIGGTILVLLGSWILISHYLGL